MRRTPAHTRAASRFFARGRAMLMALVLGVVLAGTTAAPVRADEHDPTQSGNPLRIVAYVLHPVGVIVDYLVMRPAHWLVSQEPLKTLFGHED